MDLFNTSKSVCSDTSDTRVSTLTGSGGGGGGGGASSSSGVFLYSIANTSFGETSFSSLAWVKMFTCSRN